MLCGIHGGASYRTKQTFREVGNPLLWSSASSPCGGCRGMLVVSGVALGSSTIGLARWCDPSMPQAVTEIDFRKRQKADFP